jgi:hypothetical protein
MVSPDNRIVEPPNWIVHQIGRMTPNYYADGIFTYWVRLVQDSIFRVHRNDAMLPKLKGYSGLD